MVDLNVDDMDMKEMAKNIATLTRKFNKRFYNKKKFQGTASKIQNDEDKTEYKDSSDKGPQCHECEGYGHLKLECANLFKYHKVSKKALNTTHSDDDTEESEFYED